MVLAMTASLAAATPEQEFFRKSVQAMARMMRGMDTKPGGDVDADFVNMMEPHHQGGIDMAELEIRYGRNEQLRRIAQEIIVEQQQEIAAMRLALGRTLPPSAPVPDQPGATAPTIKCQACITAASTRKNPDMNTAWKFSLFAMVALGAGVCAARAGQAPFAAGVPDIPISHSDRVYSSDQFSNTVSVIDPAGNELLGVIRLGDPQPGNFSPLYRGQVLVHGMGFSPDRKTIAVVSIGSNSVSFIDTATNTVKHTSYVGRSPHEAFFTQDGREVWVTVRGEDYLSILDAHTYQETGRIKTSSGPGMTIFSPDGRYGYVCSSFNPELLVIDVKTHAIVAKRPQPSPFCPDLAASPDGKQLWYTLKDIGKTVVINARPPFDTIKLLDTGPITNHVNLVSNARGDFAYVTVGGLNEVLVFRRDDFSQVAAIPVGKLPHGIWPSGDGTRVYVGLENDDAMAAIDTLSNKLIATIPIGQAAQAVTYVPGAVPQGDGRQGLQPLGLAGQAAHIVLAPSGSGGAPTSVSLFDQCLVQVIQASVTGLEPKSHYVLGLAGRADGGGAFEPLQAFTTNPAGAAIVDAVGPIRQIVQASAPGARRYMVIAPGDPGQTGAPVQVQKP